MNVPADDGTFDPDRILATLDAHGVERIPSADSRPEHMVRSADRDIDCVPDTDAENYERLASALRELGALPDAPRQSGRDPGGDERAVPAPGPRG